MHLFLLLVSVLFIWPTLLLYSCSTTRLFHCWLPPTNLLGSVFLSLLTIPVLARIWEAYIVVQYVFIPSKSPSFTTGTFHFWVPMKVTFCYVPRGIDCILELCSGIIGWYFYCTFWYNLTAASRMSMVVFVSACRVRTNYDGMDLRPITQHIFRHLIPNSSLFSFIWAFGVA